MNFRKISYFALFRACFSPSAACSVHDFLGTEFKKVGSDQLIIDPIPLAPHRQTVAITVEVAVEAALNAVLLQQINDFLQQ